MFNATYSWRLVKLTKIEYQFESFFLANKFRTKYKTIKNTFFTYQIIFLGNLKLINLDSITYNKKITLGYKKFLHEVDFLFISD